MSTVLFFKGEFFKETRQKIFSLLGGNIYNSLGGQTLGITKIPCNTSLWKAYNFWACSGWVWL